MKWKEIYNKCNNNEYCAITEIKQPNVLKSNFSNFLDKYSIVILVLTITLAILTFVSSNFNLQVLGACFVVLLLMLIALIYYNTYKIELKNDYLYLNIMFKEIKIKQDCLANIYLSRHRSFMFIFIPFYYYTINIVFAEGEKMKEYSVSTIMLKKGDVTKFFNRFKFIPLPKNKK